MAKIVSIGRTKEANSLESSVANLDDMLAQVACENPQLIYIGWIVDGESGSVATLQDHCDRVMALSHDSQAECKRLATALAELPQLVTETIFSELNMLLIEAKEATHSPQGASEDQR